MANGGNGRARITVVGDYVCPFCYLEEPDLARAREEFGDGVEVDWRAYELRPDPIPALDSDGEYLHRVWSASVYPMARSLGMTLRLPPVQPRGAARPLKRPSSPARGIASTRCTTRSSGRFSRRAAT